MLATPKARENFHDAWSQRATPRLARMAQASSTTTMRPFDAPGRSRASRASADWSQALAHAMSTPSAL